MLVVVLESKVVHGFLTVQEVGAPHPCIVQEPTVYFKKLPVWSEADRECGGEYALVR